MKKIKEKVENLEFHSIRKFESNVKICDMDRNQFTLAMIDNDDIIICMNNNGDEYTYYISAEEANIQPEDLEIYKKQTEMLLSTQKMREGKIDELLK